MATYFGAGPHVPSFFTDNMSTREYRSALRPPPPPPPQTRSQTRQQRRMGLQGHTGTKSSTDLRRQLLDGSVPNFGSTFNPGLGPIGSGRPGTQPLGTDPENRQAQGRT